MFITHPISKMKFCILGGIIGVLMKGDGTAHAPMVAHGIIWIAEEFLVAYMAYPPATGMTTMVALVFIMERWKDNIAEGADLMFHQAEGLVIHQAEDLVIHQAEDLALNPADQKVPPYGTS